RSPENAKPDPLLQAIGFQFERECKYDGAKQRGKSCLPNPRDRPPCEEGNQRPDPRCCLRRLLIEHALPDAIDDWDGQSRTQAVEDQHRDCRARAEYPEDFERERDDRRIDRSDPGRRSTWNSEGRTKATASCERRCDGTGLKAEAVMILRSGELVSMEREDECYA